MTSSRLFTTYLLGIIHHPLLARPILSCNLHLSSEVVLNLPYFIFVIHPVYSVQVATGSSSNLSLQVNPCGPPALELIFQTTSCNSKLHT